MVDQNVSCGQISVYYLKVKWLYESYRARNDHYPLRNQKLHSLSHTISKFVQILGCEGFAHLPAIFGKVEKWRLPHSLLSQVGQQFSIHNIFHNQQVRFWNKEKEFSRFFLFFRFSPWSVHTPRMVTTLGWGPISCMIFISWIRSSTSRCAEFSWTKIC